MGLMDCGKKGGASRENRVKGGRRGYECPYGRIYGNNGKERVGGLQTSIGTAAGSIQFGQG